MNDLLYISCPPRRVRDVMEQLSQQLTVAGIEHSVALYGNTQKINEGFAFLLSVPGFPTWFLNGLRQDEAVSDFVLCSVDEEPGQGEEDARDEKEETVHDLERFTPPVWQQLAVVEHWTKVVAQIDEPIWRDRCAVIIKELRAFQNAMRPLHEGILQSTQVLDRSRIMSSHLLEWPDEIILLLVAYQPYCQLVTESRLRQRQFIGSSMRNLVDATTDFITPTRRRREASSPSVPGCQRGGSAESREEQL